MKPPLPLPTHESAAPKGRTGRQPERKCIATGLALGPKDPAIRFVLAPDKSIVADLAHKLPGRGAWVTAERQALQRALTKGLFARAFKETARLPADLDADGFIAHVAAGLRVRALSALGLARRAGASVQGFEKLKAGLKKGEVIVYIYASDSAPDGRDKMLRLVQALDRPCPAVGYFSGIELDQALGSSNIVHLGLTKQGIATGLLRESARLGGFVDA